MTEPSHAVTMKAVSATPTTSDLVAVRQLCRSGQARTIRLQAGVSLAEVAAEVPATAAAVHRWETGQRLPRGDYATGYLAVLRRLRRAASRAAS